MKKMLLMAAGALVMSLGMAHADWKPEKPITIIVPYPAGGVTDLVVRVIANDLSPVLGQQVVVVNQAGANGTVGTRAVMDSTKDGYTWLSGGVRDIGTYAVMGMLDTRIGDWKPFVIASMASILAVNNDSKIDSVQAFIDTVKKQGDSFLIATAGPNSSGGTALSAIAQAAGITPKQIVYDGGNPAILATVSGEAQATTQLAIEEAEMIRAGRLKPIAAIGKTAITLGDKQIHPMVDDLPNLPPTENFVGIYLPKGTPDEVVATLNKIWVDVVSKSKDLATLCHTRGCGIAPMAPEQAMAAADPLIAAAAWNLYDVGQAKVSPDTLGIQRPAAK